MPPNCTSATATGKFTNGEVCNRSLKSKSNNDVSEKKINENKKKQVKKSQKFGNKCFKVLITLTTIIVASLLFFFYVPWEEYVFDENELQNYIDMYTEGDGDWVLRQFMATAEQNLTEPSFHEVDCYERGYRMERAFRAAPQTCGLVVTDTLLKPDEIDRLRSLAEKITEEIGYQSYSNRESINLRWMNLHILFGKNKRKNILKEKDYKLIKKASVQAKKLIAESFGLPYEQLHYYIVSQFTRYRSVVPFSEFRHVDKVRSPALVVTSILWLSTTDKDFGGGRLEFLTGEGPEPFTPLMLEPKKGRFAAWTSGWENPHGVMQVHWGDRLALIFAFTVNPKLGYKDLDNLREFGEMKQEIDF